MILKTVRSDAILRISCQTDGHQSGARRLPDLQIAGDLTRRWPAAGLSFTICVLALAAVGCQKEASAPAPAADQIDTDELFSGIATFQPPDTPESLEQKALQVEENLQEAEKAIAAGSLDQAIELLSKALYLDYKSRTAKLRMVETLHARSLALEATNPHQAGMDIRLAGVYLTHLRNENEDFSEDEMRLFAEVYFDEARVYGRTQHRQDEFSAAFKSALDAGFADAERVKTEPDFEQFRTHPDTAPIIDSAVSSLGSILEETPNPESAADSNP